MMKKILALSLCLLMMLPLLLACSPAEEGDEPFTVVCTVFPVYDWAKTLLEGENVELILLGGNGTDLHSYQPTAADRAILQDCDLVIRIGGESEEWVAEMLKSAPSETRKELILAHSDRIRLLDVCNTSADGGSHSHSHNHSHDTKDEHIWLSVTNAIHSVHLIADELEKTFGEEIALRAELYEEELIALKETFSRTVSSVEDPRVLVCDRFPFIYLFTEFNVDFYAAFAGCSTDAEASAFTVAQLAEILNSGKLGAVCVTESSDRALAEAVIAAAEADGCQIIALNSMQSVTKAQIDGGASYVSIMEENASALAELLGARR